MLHHLLALRICWSLSYSDQILGRATTLKKHAINEIIHTFDNVVGSAVPHYKITRDINFANVEFLFL